MPKQGTTDIPAGVYRIINVISNTSVRCYQNGQPLYVTITREFPGPFELWEIRDNGTIRNIGLDSYVSVDSSGIAVTGPNQNKFTFEKLNDDGAYFICIGDSARRARDAGKVWNVDPPVIPRGNISVQKRSGASVQVFQLIEVDV